MPPPEGFKAIVARGKDAAAQLAGPRTASTKLLRHLVNKISLGTDRVSIQLNPTALDTILGISISNVAINLDILARLKRSGHVMRLIQNNGVAVSPTVDRTLVNAIVQGRDWWRELQANPSLTLEGIARRQSITAAYVVRIIRLAFLSPTVLRRIIDGTLPLHLTLKRLTSPDAVPARWDRQFA